MARCEKCKVYAAFVDSGDTYELVCPCGELVGTCRRGHIDLAVKTLMADAEPGIRVDRVTVRPSPLNTSRDPLAPHERVFFRRGDTSVEYPDLDEGAREWLIMAFKAAESNESTPKHGVQEPG